MVIKKYSGGDITYENRNQALHVISDSLIEICCQILLRINICALWTDTYA